MYNEVDFKILESFIRCSYCDSTNVKKIGWTTTLAGGGSHEDKDPPHHMHYHDTNHIKAGYDCLDCKKEFQIVPYNSCWCGWEQGPVGQHQTPVEEIANRIWVNEGIPNGEEYRNHKRCGQIISKDVHGKEA